MSCFFRSEAMRVSVSLKRAVSIFGMVVLGLTMLAPALAQQSTAPLRIGVLPNVSARVILTTYQPVREYFERELKRGVDIATAPDFRSFAENTRRGDYDLIVTAANLGRVAQADSNWQPLAIYDPKIPAILVAMADNPNPSVAQLRGKALALANPQSLVALAGLEWLGGQGLRQGADFKTVTAANDDSLGAVLRTGEAPLAIMSLGEFRAKPEAMRNTLRIVTEIAKLPGFLVMANPGLPAAELQRLKTLILAFPQTEEGKKFFALSGFANIRDVGEPELKTLDAFNDVTRKGLAG
jgi:phosphonate transport system substrate-binding protein